MKALESSKLGNTVLHVVSGRWEKIESMPCRAMGYDVFNDIFDLSTNAVGRLIAIHVIIQLNPAGRRAKYVMNKPDACVSPVR